MRVPQILYCFNKPRPLYQRLLPPIPYFFVENKELALFILLLVFVFGLKLNSEHKNVLFSFPHYLWQNLKFFIHVHSPDI